MSSEMLIILTLLVPFAAALLIPLFREQPNLRETITITAAGVLFIAVMHLLVRVLGGERPELHVIDVVPELSLSFAIEPLGMIFAAVAATLWIVNSIYSIGYMRGNNEPRQTPFFMCFALAISSTIGIAFASNLFTLFLFYEILTLSTYPLVTHKGNDAARAAGRLYLVLLLATSTVLLLPAIILTWSLSGTLEFTSGGVLAGKADGLVVGILLGMFVFGIGKAAIMPVHFWLPAAMVAPTPVSALLHAVAVVKAGVFSVVKIIVYIFGIDFLAASGQGDWLLYVASFTVIVASIVALRQDNLKKRLAYSTISQLSYVVLAIAILTPLSAIGAAMHIAAHAVSKITLFFAAGSVYTAAHVTEISQMRGIGRKMPWTMGAFTIGALSMIGIPPTAGFLGKWFMLTGAMDTGAWVAVAVIITSTALNAGYFLPIVVSAFLRPPDQAKTDAHDHGEAPLPIVIALTLTAIGTVVLFLFPGPLYDLAAAMVGVDPVLVEGTMIPEGAAVIPDASGGAAGFESPGLESPSGGEAGQGPTNEGGGGHE